MTNVHIVKDILISLIESIDVYNFLLKEHHRRTAVIAYQLGNQYGLEPSTLSNLVLASSIHDIGAIHIDERDKLLYVDVEDPKPHELLGEKMLQGFKPFTYISKIISHHHIKYQEVASKIVPKDDVPIECYFLHLADRIDVLLTTNGDSKESIEHIIEQIDIRFGKVFNPELYETFNILVQTDEFWDNINNSSYHKLLFMAVESNTCVLDNEDLDALAALFARIVDNKSPCTSAHSKSVSVLADKIGHLVGLSEDKCCELKLAGYLHDIGKIAIPSEILEKPDTLDDNEYRVMKSHATYSALILSKLPMLGDVARWVSCHHERRNKSGYPLRINDNDFSIEIDIIAYSDIFTALAENRPYRGAMPLDEILSILKQLSIEQLDSGVYDVIEEHAEYLFNINQAIINGYSYVNQ